MTETFAIYTLGCKVNQEEGTALAALLADAGYQQVDFTTIADLYIINTCTVTHVADRKCRAMIRRAVKLNPQAVVAVVGCYAQVAPQEVAAIAGVDLVVGVNERAHLLDLISERLSAQAETPLLAVGDIKAVQKFVSIGAGQGEQTRARAYLKIEDGCDQFCNYCLVPYARGPVRSLPVAEVVKQAKAILEAGHREIVLSGIHIGAYGQDLVDIDLAGLLAVLVELPGLWRLRLGSIEPQQFTEQLLQIISEQNKICPHLHIPLQSGCDRTLGEMGRRYDTRYYASLLARLRQLRPGIAITSDLLVGYPGETADDFALTAAFCQQMAFADLHIFPYSPRRGTPAAERVDQIEAASKEVRVAQLTTLAQHMRLDYARSLIGQSFWLLPEQQVAVSDKWYWLGHAENYLPLYLPLADGNRGELIPVVLKSVDEQGFFSEPAGKCTGQAE